MTVGTFTMNKSQRLVANGAAKEDVRPVLTTVYIGKNGAGKGVAVSTDGYMLVEKHIDYDGDESIMLDAKGVAVCKDNKQTGTVTFSIGEADCMDADVDGGTRHVDVVCGTYPRYEKLFPEGKPQFGIVLSKDVLAKMLKCLDEKNGEGNIAFFFYSSSTAVEFHAGDEVRGLIMSLHTASSYR